MRIKAFAIVAAAMLLAGSGTVTRATSLRVGALSVNGDLSAATIAVVAPAPVVATAPTGDVIAWRDGIEVPLRFAPDGLQHLDVDIRAGAEHGTVRLEYYPASTYREIGLDIRGVLLLVTDLPRLWPAPVVWPPFADVLPPFLSLYSHAADWRAERAAGAAPTVGPDLDAAILALFLEFDARNDASQGELCSGQLTGIETYRAISQHACWVWCTGYANMARGFLRSAGIPARMITLQPQTSTGPDGLLVESSESHDTLEYWDGTHWVWLGPTARVLRVTLDGGPALGLDEYLAALGDPAIRARLQVTYESGGAWRTTGYDGLPQELRDLFSRYFTLDKTVDVHNDGIG